MTVDWYYLCVEMMVEYIPKDIVTWDNYNKYQEICDHFICVANILGARIKAEQNVDNLMIDHNENTAKVAALMKRLVKQNLEFAKRQLIEEG